MNKNKFDEFIRVLIPETTEDLENIYIESIYINDKYVVRASKGNKSETIEYRKIGLDYFDQKEVMVKTSLLKLYGKNYDWGGLIGVRPTKIVRRFLDMGLEYDEIENILETIYLVSKKKIDLLIRIVKTEMSYLDNKTIGIYIGIAFCPTKCTYCSFPAYLKTGKYNERYNEYFNSLIVEIKEMGKLISETGLKVNTIYIGGGTPSILSNEEIDEMLKCVNENIDMKNIKEFTFEAGRIDTINKEKLETMKKWNIDRISINPQSFNERTLKLVNRYHKREKFDEVFEDAKQLGFIINMDLIIGLPEESTKDVLHTLNELNKYDIENLTIHNLAIKKASKLQKESYEHESNLDYKIIHEKIENVVNAKDLNAYYMYRQKNSFVWGENVGYSKIGLESIYNIEMIEENKMIIGIGAGSMTKVVFEKENRTIIERLVNPKDPLVWIDELQKRMEEKKKRIMEVYK